MFLFLLLKLLLMISKFIEQQCFKLFILISRTTGENIVDLERVSLERENKRSNPLTFTCVCLCRKRSSDNCNVNSSICSYKCSMCSWTAGERKERLHETRKNSPGLIRSNDKKNISGALLRLLVQKGTFVDHRGEIVTSRRLDAWTLQRFCAMVHRLLRILSEKYQGWSNQLSREFTYLEQSLPLLRFDGFQRRAKSRRETNTAKDEDRWSRRVNLPLIESWPTGCKTKTTTPVADRSKSEEN